jgi:hypothetical protein
MSSSPWSFGSLGRCGALMIAAIALLRPASACAQQEIVPAECPERQASPPAVEADPYAAILAQQAIDPSRDAIVAYLQSLRPSEENRQFIAARIAELGSDHFERRELATRQLIALPVLPADDLRLAIEADGGEIGLRAQQVLAARSAGNPSASVAVACFRTITKKHLTGAAPALLDVLPLYGEEFVLAAGREALKVTCRPEDAALLRKAAHKASIETRVAAVGALAAVLGDQARAELLALLKDGESRVKLAAARALADHGDRACLGALIDLLAARDLRVRHASAGILRTLTGRASDYVAWLDPDTQADAIQDWQSWLAREGRTCPLHYPLRAADLELGRTLVCLYAKNQIVEFDSTGRQTFNVSEPGGCPWACQGLPTGGRLVALYSSNTVVEYRADGNQRTRIPVPGGPMSVQRLENGNTLVACNNAQKVVEVDDNGKIACEVALSGGPCDATRLENGHTLVTLQNANAVVEIDPRGREVWKVEGLRTPRSATRLENGNTLVCDLGSGRVIEFDARGEEVWSQAGFSSPFGAQRLIGGTTLVSDTAAIKEIDHDGKVIAEKRQSSLGRVFRF